jgi:hypothetical protein
MSATSLIDWTVSAPLSLLSAAAADAGGLPAAATVLATFAAGGDFTHHRWPLVSAPTSSSSTAASKVVSAIVMLIFSVDVDAALVGLRLSDLMLTHGAPELRQMLEEQGLVDALVRPALPLSIVKTLGFTDFFMVSYVVPFFLSS